MVNLSNAPLNLPLFLGISWLSLEEECICIIYEDNWDEKSICSVDRAWFVSDGMADPAGFDIDQVETHSINLF